VALLGGRSDTALWLPGVGDMYVTSTGGRNVRVGGLLGAGLDFTDAAARMDNPTLEGASAIKVFGGALVKLTDRGVVAERDFPLMRHLYEVVALERPLNIPWRRFFGGEPGRSDEIARADAQGNGETRLRRHPSDSSANAERTSSHG
jgi:glycerol-3-phosphate dehydrogenase (NAD(P)+)